LPLALARARVALLAISAQPPARNDGPQGRGR
jgi:hypothetical protein